MAGEVLRVISGPMAGEEIALDGDLAVGRIESGSGNLGDDPELSRHHACFRALDTGRLLVEDRGSTNGTYVNGRQIAVARVLSPGDRITLGTTVLELQGGGPEAPPRRDAAAVSAPQSADRPSAGPGSGRTPSRASRPWTGLPPPAGTPRSAGERRTALLLGLGTFALIVSGVVALLAIRGGGASDACVGDDGLRSGPGHFRFITSACENASRTVARFPLHRGTSHGQTVWYVLTDDSNQADARARGLNYVPKLANAASSAGIQVVAQRGGMIDFPATVDFKHQRLIRPGPSGFPPARAQPPAFAPPAYSPLIRLPDGTVLDAPHVANASGRAAKVVSLDTGHLTVGYRETEGRYEDKHVHYASFDAASPVAAAIEDVSYTPALNSVPRPGDEAPQTSAREELIAFVNGPTGTANPQRQGINSTILDNVDPHNILHETPVLPGHADVGDPAYSPMWDVHLAEWTARAVRAGDRAELRHVDELNTRVGKGLVTGVNGATFGPSGFVVNCPLISIDVP